MGPGLDEYLKAAIDQTVTIEWHRVVAGCMRGSAITFFPVVVAHLTRRPGDPREHERFIGLAFDCHWKRGELPV